MQVKLAGKAYTIKESIKNTRRAYIYQKAIMELYKKATGTEDETEEIVADVSANEESLDIIINYLIDLIGEDKVATEYFEENVSLIELRSAAQKATEKLVGAEGESEGKKSTTTKPSEESTSSAEN